MQKILRKRPKHTLRHRQNIQWLKIDIKKLKKKKKSEEDLMSYLFS